MGLKTSNITTAGGLLSEFVQCQLFSHGTQRLRMQIIQINRSRCWQTPCCRCCVGRWRRLTGGAATFTAESLKFSDSSLLNEYLSGVFPPLWRLDDKLWVVDKTRHLRTSCGASGNTHKTSNPDINRQPTDREIDSCSSTVLWSSCVSSWTLPRTHLSTQPTGMWGDMFHGVLKMMPVFNHSSSETDLKKVQCGGFPLCSPDVLQVESVLH